MSNKLKASRISSISSSLKPGRSYVLAVRLDPAGAFLVACLGASIWSEMKIEYKAKHRSTQETLPLSISVV